MESRAYNFSTAKKRSTQLKSKVISFPREDDNAPRTMILKKECPDTFHEFRQCMKANNNDENVCYEKKQALDACAAVAFRKVNTSKDYNW